MSVSEILAVFKVLGPTQGLQGFSQGAGPHKILTKMHNLSGRQGRSGRNMTRQRRGNCLAALWAMPPGWMWWGGGRGECCKLVAPMTSVLKGHPVWRDLHANVTQLQLHGRAILEWGLGEDSQGRRIECGGE